MAREVIANSRHDLEAITQALMEYETISGEECMAVTRGERIVRPTDDEDSRGPMGSAVPSAGATRPPRGEPESGGMAPQPQA